MKFIRKAEIHVIASVCQILRKHLIKNSHSLKDLLSMMLNSFYYCCWINFLNSNLVKV